MTSPWKKGTADARQARDNAVAVLSQARSLTVARVQPDIGRPLDIGGIGKKALDAWSKQWQPRRPLPDAEDGWDWDAIADKLARTPDRFDRSIWSESTLCGLAIGAPVKKGNSSYLGVLFIEGNPNPSHPLSGLVMPVVVQAAFYYAVALGLRHLRMLDPFPDLVEYYVTRFGFSLCYGARQACIRHAYCIKEIADA